MKELIINADPLETRIALVESGRLAELTIERSEAQSVVGNVYKGRVDSIVPGIQAAFVDIGLEKNGFLYVSDIAGTEGTGDFDFEEGVGLPKSKSRRAKRPRFCRRRSDSLFADFWSAAASPFAPPRPPLGSEVPGGS